MRTLSLARLVALAALVAAPGTVHAQSVGIDPHVVFLSHRARSGGVTLYNTGSSPVEVSVSTVFGFIGTDTLGSAVVVFPERPAATEPNAAPWVAIFPRRMTIPAGGEQEVRFQARPADGLLDGEYWARVVVTARNVEPPPSAPSDTTGVSVRLRMETRTVIPLFYRKGELATGVAMSALRAEVQGDSIAIGAHLERTGTAAFVGTVRAAITDTSGKAVAGMERPLAVYRTADPRWMLPLPRPLAPGRYRVTLALSTARSDVAATNLLQAAPAEQSLELTLPGTP